MPSPAILFAYGTLLEEEVWRRVVGDPLPSVAGWCTGFVAYRVSAADYPGLVPAESDERTMGRVFVGVDDAMLDRLDAYEGPQYTRQVIEVMCSDGQSRGCWVYLWKPELAPLLTTERWPGASLESTSIPSRYR